MFISENNIDHKTNYFQLIGFIELKPVYYLKLLIQFKMKTTVIKSLFVGLITLLFTQTGIAQKSDYELIYNELSPNQKEMLQAQHQMMIQNRHMFKESLSKKQLAILADENLTQDVRKKNLKATFSKKQKEMLQAQERHMNQVRKQFRQSLNPQQKLMLQERLRQRTQNAAENDELQTRNRTQNKLNQNQGNNGGNNGNGN